MIINPSSGDVRQLLRIVAPPVLALGALLVVGEVSPLDAWTTTLEASRRVVTVLDGAWLIIATGMAVHRTRRDAHAHKRLQELRDAAQAPGRALVHVEAVAWHSRAGQHTVVVNVATGHCYHLWFPEAHLVVGSYVVIEQREVGVSVVDWLITDRVVAGHRHGARHTQSSASSPQSVELARSRNADEEAAALIRETEDFLESL